MHRCTGANFTNMLIVFISPLGLWVIFLSSLAAFTFYKKHELVYHSQKDKYKIVLSGLIESCSIHFIVGLHWDTRQEMKHGSVSPIGFNN